MPTTVKMHEAKTHLSSLVARAVAGEDIVIARGDRPQVRLVSVEDRPRGPRVPGRLAGQISVPDSFFEPMSEEELALWEGR